MPRTSTSGVALPYDFRRPNKFNREHLRALQIANETFARQFTTALSTTLRAVSQVASKGIGQLTYDEYIREVPNPTLLTVLSLAPLPGASIFHVPLPVVMAAVDRLLGGKGTGVLPRRPLTDIEAALVRTLLGRILRELAYAFEPLTNLEPQVLQLESNPQFAQIASPTDMVVVLEYDIRVGSDQGDATLCIPFASLQPVLDELTGNALLAGRVASDPTAVRGALGERLGAAPATVSVRFEAITLSMAEIIDLCPGDVVSLHHPVTADLAVSVDGVRCFSATPGRRGKRLACLITGTLEEPATPAPAGVALVPAVPPAGTALEFA